MVSYLSVEESVKSKDSYQFCEHCEMSIAYKELAIQLLVGNLTDNGFEVSVVDGDIEFEPKYYHSKCWDKVFQDILNTTEKDTTPFVPAEAILTCAICGYGIRHSDTFGLARLGTLKQSEYSPNGEDAEEFEVRQDDCCTYTLCLCCMDCCVSDDDDEDELKEKEHDSND